MRDLEMANMFAWILLLAVAPLISALDFAAAKGPYLVNNATQGAITMNGIWYSTSNSTTDINAMDPLKDAKACTRDAALMAQVGINTIYVMAIDTKVNHDDCFSIFNSVGIYVMVVLRKDGVFDTGYDDFVKSYNTDFLKGMFEIVDAVKDYENLLGFDIGVLPMFGGVYQSETKVAYGDAMKIYRAFIRDIKTYISAHALRPILVGSNLHLVRTDELLDASDQTVSHLYYFTCAIDGASTDLSRSDYVSFYNLGYFETSPVEKQNASYVSLASHLTSATVPTWFSAMGIFDEADYVEYELRPDLLNDTLFLYNSSSQLLRPRGPYTGGARVMWSNTNAGYKVPGIVNWGLTTTSPSGDIILTNNYDAYRQIIDKVNPGTWLSGNIIPSSSSLAPVKCDSNARELANRTIEPSELDPVTLATDWTLPTRPAGLDAIISSGATGQRGQMVDVTSTAIAYAIRDSNGSSVTNIVLKPSASSTRTVTPTSRVTTGAAESSSSALSTGAKAGIGAGVGVGVGAMVGLGLGLFMRRRKRKLRSSPPDATSGDSVDAYEHNAGGFGKAELATGPGVEKQHAAELAAGSGELAEVDGQGRKVCEVDAGMQERKYEMMGTANNVEPVELPVNEPAVEVPGSTIQHR